MREALAVAARARTRTAPNPTVGALVVRNGRVIARAATRGLEAHAEAIALARAGREAKGATLYVTLEPCAHFGRTPPCVESVIASRPKRVVIGLVDPDPRTRGASIRALARAGIDVRTGVLADACARHHEGFVSRVLRGRPFTTLKLAASLDGRIATSSGESRWITSEPARAFVHRLRARTDAVVIGSETLLADDPELSARRGGRVVHRPLRVVVDSRLRTPPTSRVLDRERAEGAWILCARDVPPRRRARLERAGARVIGVRSARRASRPRCGLAGARPSRCQRMPGRGRRRPRCGAAPRRTGRPYAFPPGSVTHRRRRPRGSGGPWGSAPARSATPEALHRSAVGSGSALPCGVVGRP